MADQDFNPGIDPESGAEIDAGAGAGSTCGAKCRRPMTDCCGPRPSWTTIASGPAASWRTSDVTPKCRCCAICCPWWTTLSRAIAGGREEPRFSGTAGRLSDGRASNLRTCCSGTIAGGSRPWASRSIPPAPGDLAAALGDQPENTVVAVAQDGYQLHDRVVRPAQVIVSTNPAGGNGR